MNVICGINAVLEALGAGTRSFDRLLIVKGTRNRRVSEVIARASQLGVPLRFESRETLDRVGGDVAHQGVIAMVSAKAVVELDELVDHAREPGLLVALDGVEDPRNLGAILRTVDACGAHGVILPERHSAGLSETVARTSAGGLEHVRVARVGNLVQALGTIKARGYWVVGLDANGTERWDAVDYKKPIVLVLGGEGRGIRRLVREHCDHLVSLPLFGHVSSLNVSVAAGIALYEVVRQRGSVPSQVRPIPSKRTGPDVDGGRPAAWQQAAAPGAAAEPGEAGEESAAAGSVFMPEEDVTWPQAPVMLPDRERRRRRQERQERQERQRGRKHGKDDRPRRRKREDGSRDVPRQRPPSSESSGPVLAAGEAAAEGAPGAPPSRQERLDRLRRKRRARWRKGSGASTPGGAGERPPTGATEAPSGGESGAGERPPGSPGGGREGAPGRPRRRRRRRGA